MHVCDNIYFDMHVCDNIYVTFTCVCIGIIIYAHIICP